jgi:hypothetical protein
MAHDVTFIIPERSLGKADVEFKIKRDGEAGGTLKVSNGSVVWVPAGKQYGYKMKWKDLDRLMKDHGKSERA